MRIYQSKYGTIFTACTVFTVLYLLCCTYCSVLTVLYLLYYTILVILVFIQKKTVQLMFHNKIFLYFPRENKVPSIIWVKLWKTIYLGNHSSVWAKKFWGNVSWPTLSEIYQKGLGDRPVDRCVEHASLRRIVALIQGVTSYFLSSHWRNRLVLFVSSRVIARRNHRKSHCR
jgi:hypothetical protein